MFCFQKFTYLLYRNLMLHPSIYFFLFFFLFVIYRVVYLYTFGFSLPFYGVVFPKNTRIFCIVFFSICIVLGLCYSVFFFIVSLTASALVESLVSLSAIENPPEPSEVGPKSPDDPSFFVSTPQEKSTFLERCKNTLRSYIDVPIEKGKNAVQSCIDQQVGIKIAGWKEEDKDLAAAVLPTTESKKFDSFASPEAFAEAKGSDIKEQTQVVGIVELENGQKGIVINPAKTYELTQIAGDSQNKGYASTTKDELTRGCLKVFKYDKNVCVVRKEGDIAGPSLVESPSLKPVLTKAPALTGKFPQEINIPKSPNSPDHRIEDAF